MTDALLLPNPALSVGDAYRDLAAGLRDLAAEILERGPRASAPALAPPGTETVDAASAGEGGATVARPIVSVAAHVAVVARQSVSVAAVVTVLAVVALHVGMRIDPPARPRLGVAPTSITDATPSPALP